MSFPFPAFARTFGLISKVEDAVKYASLGRESRVILTRFSGFQLSLE